MRNGLDYDYLQKSRGESIEMPPHAANNFQDGGAAWARGPPRPPRYLPVGLAVWPLHLRAVTVTSIAAQV